ncbi:thioredoxin family protein [Microbacterium sp.]|uniref:thioredoxin family protein n=1 Tax=Microbacterium sp. TaxID=51671 RepID=UPI003C78ADD1
MEPIVAAAVVAALVAVAVVVGFVGRALSGRKQRRRRADVTASDLGLDALAEVATIVQFSTEYCARCPGVRRALNGVVAGEPGVVLTEIDLTHRPELAARFRILTTPTVFVVDRRGVIAASFAGAVSAASVRTEIAALREPRSATPTSPASAMQGSSPRRHSDVIVH